jgi:ATP adenylyltransferase
MRGLLGGLLDESFGCGGLTLASELGQSQLSDVLQRTRVQWELLDYSNRAQTVSNANRASVTVRFHLLHFPNIFPARAHLLTCPAMDYLWTPWRYAYVSSAEKSTGCVFCDLVKLNDDEKALIVHRAEHCFVVLNRYPYTPGHAMVVPYAHLDELKKLPREAANEMMALTQRMETVLRELYHPDGINLGMNIGKAAGAGIAAHIHMHVLPRWVADANFMSVVGETRILPETLEETWKRMSKAMAK